MTCSIYVKPPPQYEIFKFFCLFILFIFLLNNLMFMFLDPFVKIEMSYSNLFDILFSIILYIFYNIFLDHFLQHWKWTLYIVISLKCSTCHWKWALWIGGLCEYDWNGSKTCMELVNPQVWIWTTPKILSSYAYSRILPTKVAFPILHMPTFDIKFLSQ